MKPKFSNEPAVDYCHTNSPLGKILIAATQSSGTQRSMGTSPCAVLGLWFEGQKYEVEPTDNWVHNPSNPVLNQLRTQLEEYFNQTRVEFDVPLQLSGTDFQRSVWQKLLEIPGGSTITYGELARRLAKPAAVRAAAAAVGKNPASIIVPCHRVIGANGSLTGYAGGLQRKQQLLSLELADMTAASH